MREKAAAAAKMIVGDFTPYLLANWGSDERRVIADWGRGEIFDGAVWELEKELAAGLGDGWFVRGTNLGRAAIQAGLEALTLEPGREVLLPSYGCLGTVVPVVQAGLEPVFVDVDESFNISYESVVAAVTDRTRAIIAPHLSGARAADFDRIIEFSRKKNIWVIEDAAQSQGLISNGKPAGTIGDIGIFSAHGGKMILSSGGGWLATRNEKIAERLRGMSRVAEPRGAVDARLKGFLARCAASPRQQGMRYLRDAFGSKMNRAAAGLALDDGAMGFTPAGMSGVEARLIHFQLKRLDEFVAKRAENARLWRRGLEGLPLKSMRLPREADNIFAKYLLSFEGSGGERESIFLRRTLLANGIECEPSYRPLHLRAPFDERRRTRMDGTDLRWTGAFSVPARPNLTAADWKRIDKALFAAGRSMKGRLC